MSKSRPEFELPDDRSLCVRRLADGLQVQTDQAFSKGQDWAIQIASFAEINRIRENRSLFQLSEVYASDRNDLAVFTWQQIGESHQNSENFWCEILGRYGDSALPYFGEVAAFLSGVHTAIDDIWEDVEATVSAANLGKDIDGQTL